MSWRARRLDRLVSTRRLAGFGSARPAPVPSRGPALLRPRRRQADGNRADVVLGLVRAKEFLDGRMPLDRDAAVAAVGQLAKRLDLTVEETAAGILRINNMQAATVIRQQTVERGLDPRDFVLYAFGGAGPVHAFGYAAESGRNVSTLVFKRNQPARVDHFADDVSALAAAAGEIGMRSAVGAPISVEGRLWGVMIVASTHEDALPAGTEHRLAEFTELVATTIANAQAREELSTLAAAEVLRDRASIAWVGVTLAAEQVADGAGR